MHLRGAPYRQATSERAVWAGERAGGGSRGAMRCHARACIHATDVAHRVRAHTTHLPQPLPTWAGADPTHMRPTQIAPSPHSLEARPAALCVAHPMAHRSTSLP